MNRADLKLFIRGSAVSMCGIAVLGIMNYLIRRTLLLNLADTDFGFFYSAFALVMIIMVFLDLGLAQSAAILLIKSFSEKNQEKANKVFTLSFVARILLALLVLGIMELLAPYLTRYYFKYSGSSVLLMLIFLLIPLQTLESALSCVFIACKAFKTQNILINLRAFIILFGVFLTVRYYGLRICILWFIAAGMIVAVAEFFIVRTYGISLISLERLDMHDVKNIFSLSSWIAVSTAGISVMYYLDTVCLTWLAGLEAVAIYNIALPIMQIAQSFFVFPAVFTPFAAEMWEKKDYAGIRKTCCIGSLLMLLTLPVFVWGGVCFAPDIITLLFDGKYAAAAPAVTILWAGMVFFSIATFNISALNSGGRQQRAAFLVIGCVIVNFILNTVLIPEYGYIGAALATAATYMIMALGAIVNLLIVFYKSGK
ncbi:MAG: flippase [Victivallaceae bacterium]|nr:flippase [Victivallaceae bacterium]